MDQLEKVFKGLNIEGSINYILADYDLFFANQNSFARFSLDEEDIPLLKKTISYIKKNDDLLKVFVCIYRDELTDNNNKKFIYADSLWILTNLEIHKLSNLFHDLSPDISPSSISAYESVEELINSGIKLISGNENTVCFLNEYSNECLKNLKIIYWD